MVRGIRFALGYGVMRTMLSYIGSLIIAIAVCLAFGVAVPCQASEGQDYEAAFLARINEARQDPSGVAGRLGMTLDPLIARFPDLHDELMNGMPQLIRSSTLAMSAAEHALDLIEKGYYSKISQDGRTVEDRMRDAGYLPAEADEAIGMIGFNNFFDPNMAVNAIFENFFREQVNSGEPIFLNPGFTDVGISFQTGTMPIGGKLQNFYLVTVDVGSSLNDTVEKAVYRMINDLRREPERVEMILDLGGEDGEELALLGAEGHIPDRWMPPLAWNKSIHLAAEAHANDMADRLYFSSVSPEGKTPSDRLADREYSSDCVLESLTAAITDQFSENPFEIASILLKQMIKGEMDSGPKIFSSDIAETGIGFVPKALDMGDDNKVTIYILVADYAMPSIHRSHIMGNVYHNKPVDEVSSKDSVDDETHPQIFGYGDNFPADPDRGFDLGEGIGCLQVCIAPLDYKEDEACIDTDSLGGYQLPLPETGYHDLTVSDEDGNILKRSIMMGLDNNYLKDLSIR